MDLGDVLAERELTKEEVGAAVGALFSLEPQDVLVVDDLAEVFGLPMRSWKVLCEKRKLAGGDFRTLLCFQETKELPQLPRVAVVSKLAELLKCRCLISDTSLYADNRFSFIQIDPEGGWQQVFIDPDREFHDEYVVIKSMPLEADRQDEEPPPTVFEIMERVGDLFGALAGRVVAVTVMAFIGMLAGSLIVLAVGAVFPRFEDTIGVGPAIGAALFGLLTVWRLVGFRKVLDQRNAPNDPSSDYRRRTGGD